MDRTADGCHVPMCFRSPYVLDNQSVLETGQDNPKGKSHPVPFGSDRAVRLHVLLSDRCQQDDPGFQFAVQQPATDLGIHPVRSLPERTDHSDEDHRIAIGLGGALLCILTQKSDDLASDAFTGNMLCMLSSIAYAAYLIISNVVLGRVSSLNMLRYSFLGAAFSSLVVMAFTGFDAHLFSHFEWTPFLVLMFVLIFPTTISYLLIPIGLKYLSTTLVALYGYLILIVATIVSLSIGQDRFSWYQMIAIALICSSVYFVEIAESKDKATASK